MSNDIATKKLIFRMEAQLGKYHEELAKSRRETKKWRNKISGDIDGVKTKFRALAAAASIDAVTAYYSAHANGIDNLAKASDKLGTPIAKLQGLHMAGELSGVSVNTLNMGLQRMARRVAEAAKGTGEAQGALRELGLDAERLAQLSPDEQFIRISRAMEGVTNQGDRVRLSMKLFDSEGVALVNTLALGEEALRNTAKEIEGYGGALTRVDAAKVELANDTFTRAGKIIKAFGTRLVVQLAPVIGAIANRFVTASNEAGGFGNVGKKAAGIIVQSFGIVRDGIHGIKIGFMLTRQAVAEVVSMVLQLGGSVSAFGGGLANKLGFDAEGLKNFADFSEGFKLTTKSLREDLQAAMLQPLPSEKMKAWVEQVYADADIAAREIAANANISLVEVGDVEQDVRLQHERDVATAIADIDAKEKNKRLRQEAVFQAKIIDFQRASSAMKVKTLIAEAAQITQGASHTSKKLFKINKAAALADAAVTLPSAVLKAVERGGGWPWGAAFGALTLANGLAQINSIRKAKFGGGASASLSGSGGGATPTFDVSSPSERQGGSGVTGSENNEAPRNLTQVIFNGDNYGFDDFEDVVLTMLASASDTSRIVVTDESGRIILRKT